jgi:hypothetical protein
MEVSADRPQEMNLLGLVMAAALRERLPALERARAAGDVAIESGGMAVTLSFGPDGVVVRSGIHGDPRTRLLGDLDALAAVAQGKLIGPVLRRNIRISGDPRGVLPLANVFGGGLARSAAGELKGLLGATR